MYLGGDRWRTYLIAGKPEARPVDLHGYLRFPYGLMKRVRDRSLQALQDKGSRIKHYLTNARLRRAKGVQVGCRWRSVLRGAVLPRSRTSKRRSTPI